MRKFTAHIDVPAGTVRGRTSLGLRTRKPFELQILEIAIGGRKVLEKYWKEEGEKFDISEQVMCLEILKEFEQFEKDGSIDSIVERARDQVVKMKGNKNLHHRALLVYRYYLNLSISRESVAYDRQIQREGSSDLIPERRERESKTYSRSSQMLTIDERLDLMIDIELPEILWEDSSSLLETGTKTQEGEQSESSCEIVSLLDDNVSCETLSIFERPAEAEGFISHGSFVYHDEQEKSLSAMWLYAEKSEERDSMFSQRDSFVSPMMPEKSMPWNDDVELKIDYEDENRHKALGSFPGKDFKIPIEWKLDKITFKAMSLSDLRRNHDILMEGSFRKKGGRCHTWRGYYGFLLDTGVLLYFRKEEFMKSIDFRKSTPFIPKSKQFKLNIRGLYVDSKPSNWLLKFADEKKLNTWYEALLKFSHTRNNSGLEQLLGPPVEVN